MDSDCLKGLPLWPAQAWLTAMISWAPTGAPTSLFLGSFSDCVFIRQSFFFGHLQCYVSSKKKTDQDLEPSFLQGKPTVLAVLLPHLVGDDLPHGIHDGVIGHIMRQGQGRGDDGPGAEMGPGLEEAQARIAGASRAMLAAHLQHVGICPAARFGQVLLRPLDRGQQIAHDAAVRSSHVSGGPEGLNDFSKVSM